MDSLLMSNPNSGVTSKTPSGPRLAGRRILLVEDEMILALDISMELEDEGAEVVVATSLEQADEIVRVESGFDGAVLDVNLRGKEVFPVAAKLRERSVPIVFHTGHGRAELIGRDYPSAVVLVKPALSGRIARSVQELLEAA